MPETEQQETPQEKPPEKGDGGDGADSAKPSTCRTSRR